jgi:hypothetical protein
VNARVNGGAHPSCHAPTSGPPASPGFGSGLHRAGSPWWPPTRRTPVGRRCRHDPVGGQREEHRRERWRGGNSSLSRSTRSRCFRWAHEPGAKRRASRDASKAGAFAAVRAPGDRLTGTDRRVRCRGRAGGGRRGRADEEPSRGPALAGRPPVAVSSCTRGHRPNRPVLGHWCGSGSHGGRSDELAVAALLPPTGPDLGAALANITRDERWQSPLSARKGPALRLRRTTDDDRPGIYAVWYRPWYA